jgi:F-type H+-transporting ATPase subunit b
MADPTEPTVAMPAHEAGGAVTHTTTATEEDSGGLPQFQFQHWGGQIAYLLVLFVILYVLVSKVFAPRMRRVFDEREQTIATALDTARRVQADALEQAKVGEAELAEARGRAQRVSTEARAKANAEATEVSAAEEARLADKIAAAERDIRAARDAAMTKVSGIAEDIAASLVAKLVGAEPSAAELKAALSRQGAR